MMSFEKQNNGANNCGRKEELVSYLYDEISAAERATFARHLHDCDSCRSELDAFGRVRDDLSAWQVGYAPRTEISLQKSRTDVWRDFVNLFPLWARGAALTAAAVGLLLFALSFAGINLSGKAGAGALQASMTTDQIKHLVNEAVAQERAQMEREYRAQVTSIEQRLSAEQEAQLQALSAANQAQMAALKAGLKAEIKKSNRQNSSIRSFFALDDSQDPLGDVR
jgi:anti-sigma factor RsiW